MRRTVVKRDANHAPIKVALIQAGRPVWDVAHLAGFGCDLVAEHLDGYPIFLEIKKPGPPSVRRLTDSEKQLQAMFPRFYAVAQSELEALRAVGLAL